MTMHRVLGYVVIVLAIAGYISALRALRRRSGRLNDLMFAVFILSWLAQVAALATGVVDNAVAIVSPQAAALAPYQFFLGASLSTLTGVLVAWRYFNAQVLWDEDRWLSYHVAALGQVMLSIGLSVIGRLAVGG